MEPKNDVLGLLTQIDNMTCGLEKAQSEQEPVAWMYEIFGDTVLTTNQKKIDLVLANGKTVTPLYTAPPSKPWVSLTSEELASIVVEHAGFPTRQLAAIEAALRSKNT